jgi:hypothetical protein
MFVRYTDGRTTQNAIIIVINRQELRLDRPDSTSSNNLFKGLPNRLRPLRLSFSIIFGTLLFFILITRHSQFDLTKCQFSRKTDKLKRKFLALRLIV